MSVPLEDRWLGGVESREGWGKGSREGTRAMGDEDGDGSRADLFLFFVVATAAAWQAVSDTQLAEPVFGVVAQA